MRPHHKILLAWIIGLLPVYGFLIPWLVTAPSSLAVYAGYLLIPGYPAYGLYRFWPLLGPYFTSPSNPPSSNP